MTEAFVGDFYLLKKQKIALTGTYRFFDANQQLVAYSKQKALKLREDIRVYADEKQTQELLIIQARGALDFSATYDVTDSATGQRIGSLRRKGLKSMARDTWEILDAGGQVAGELVEDSAMKAFLRRAFLGSLLPQQFDLTFKGQAAGTFKQRFSFVGYEMEIHFQPGGALDHRLGIAASVLLAAIEGKQSN